MIQRGEDDDDKDDYSGYKPSVLTPLLAIQ